MGGSGGAPPQLAGGRLLWVQNYKTNILFPKDVVSGYLKQDVRARGVKGVYTGISGPRSPIAAILTLNLYIILLIIAINCTYPAANLIRATQTFFPGANLIRATQTLKIENLTLINCTLINCTLLNCTIINCTRHRGKVQNVIGFPRLTGTLLRV